MRQVKKVICEICGQEISKSNYIKHIERHRNNPNSFEESKYKLKHDGLNCQFCGKTCKNRNSLCNHERLCKENPDRQVLNNINHNIIEGFNNKGRTAWNKGLTKDTDERVKYISEHMKQIMLEKGHIGYVGLKGSENVSVRIDVREKISKRMSERYAFPRGWAKRGWYKNIWCDSSWELAYILFAEDHYINFERNRKSFEYIWDGYTHHYTPDFYLPDINSYLEIKGQYDEKVEAKVKQFPENLIIYQYDEMKPILEYVMNKYGEDFTSLYENIMGH